MKDETYLRALSISGGVVLVLVSALAGVDGDLKIAAAGLLGFGLGTGLKYARSRSSSNPNQ